MTSQMRALLLRVLLLQICMCGACRPVLPGLFSGSAAISQPRISLPPQNFQNTGTALELSHNPEFLSHPRISSQNYLTTQNFSPTPEFPAKISHNPEFLFHPRISSQNTGTALQLNCTQHDFIPYNIKEVWGQCILSVHCREEGCVGLYIQADQEISRDTRGEARARGKSWGWSPFFHH